MFKNMKIGKKLIIFFVIVTLISSLAGIISIFVMSNSDREYSNALTNYGFSQGDVGLLMSTLNENATNIIMTIASDDANDVSDAKQAINDNVNLINSYMEAIQPTLTSPEEQSNYNIISENLPLFSQSANQLMEYSSKNQNEQALATYKNDLKPVLDKIMSGVQGLMNSNKTNGDRLSAELTTSSYVSIAVMCGLIVVSLVVSILIAVFSSRSISRPMAACSERLVKLSNGDLRTPVPVVNTRDETGYLSKATTELVDKLSTMIDEMTSVLGEMADGNLNVTHDHVYSGDFGALHTSTVQIISSLNDTLTQINRSSDQVASGSDQVSAGAQSLSQGATEQASAVQELAATINEISSQVKENADNAKNANNMVANIAEEMGESNRQMQNMIQAMGDISNSSNEINKIIKAIEDIAFQTNILALNAAVEAARAGAAGKGFAVVADEVRSLASKSQEAAKSTTALIQHSIEAVANGTQIADATAQSLLEAVNGTKEATETMSRITEASNRQAESIAQVTQGIEQISSVVQTNSATAEESAAASEELSSQAQVMKSLVGRFRLNGNDQDSSYSGSYSPSAASSSDYVSNSKY